MHVNYMLINHIIGSLSCFIRNRAIKVLQFLNTKFFSVHKTNYRIIALNLIKFE